MKYFDENYKENRQAYDESTKNNIGFTPIALIDDETWAKHAGKDDWDIIGGEFKDISEQDDYKLKIQTQENTAKKVELQAQINELDLKRIRAICEPLIKDETTGQTWLEYYTEQIVALRAELNSLN